MTAIATAQLMAHVDITPSHLRHHVSNDNPCSESQFRTMKYMPDLPERFGCIEHVVTHFTSVFFWHNNEHHHSGTGFLTPADIHFNRTAGAIAQRQAVLDQAHLLHLERFARRPPVPPRLPDAVWINPPTKDNVSTEPTYISSQPSVSHNA